MFLNRKLRDVLQRRLIKFFLDQSKKDPEKYNKFFGDYGLFIREGIVTTHEQDVKVRVHTGGRARCNLAMHWKRLMPMMSSVSSA